MRTIIEGKDWQIPDKYSNVLFGYPLEETKDSPSETKDGQNDSEKQPLRLYAADYFERSLSLFGFTPSPFNLGVYQTVNNNFEKVLRATQYVGVVPMLKKNQNLKASGKDKEQFLIKISSRFHISPTEMIDAVLSGDDYYENPDMLKTRSYSEAEWRKLAGHQKIGKNQEEKILLGMINGTGSINLFANSEGKQEKASDTDLGIIDAYGVFEIIDFVNKAKEVCKKNLKRQSQSVEENLNCRVRGKILIQKQIKYNVSKGQNQRVYCSYNKMTENIRENQIIKYALHLCQKKHGIGDSLAEDIRYCMNTLRSVPLKKCSTADFVGLKNNGAFRQYKDALNAAKKVIGRYSLSYSDQKKKDTTEAAVQLSGGKVLPYFIDMNLLFEYFCRAVFKKAIANYNARPNGIKFELESTKKARRRLFAGENSAKNIEKFFMGTYIPDIVINYSTDAANKEWKVAAVFDTKYSDIAQQTEARRARTHQILFYMMALGCECGGLISPYPGEESEFFKNNPDKNSGEDPAKNLNTENMTVAGQLGTKEKPAQLFYIPLCPLSRAKDGDTEKKQSAFEHYAELTERYLAKIADAVGLPEKKEQDRQDACDEILRKFETIFTRDEACLKNKDGRKTFKEDFEEAIRCIKNNQDNTNDTTVAGTYGMEKKDE